MLGITVFVGVALRLEIEVRDDNVCVFLTEGEAREWADKQEESDFVDVFQKTVYVPWLSVGAKSANKQG